MVRPNSLYVGEGSSALRLHTYSFYRNITINVEEPLGWSDGTYIRAQATDIEGNTCTADLTVLKDAAPPANVTNLSAELNEDKTAVVLTWDNPRRISHMS